MASALSSLANATALLQVPVAGTIEDPDTGNISANMEEIPITLYLRQGGATPQDLRGVQVDGDFFDGYAIAPQILDLRVQPGTQGTLSFGSDPPLPCTVASARFAYGNQGVIGSTLQSVLGDKIRITRYRQA